MRDRGRAMASGESAHDYATCRAGGTRLTHLRLVDGDRTLCGRPVRGAATELAGGGPTCFSCETKRKSREALPDAPLGFATCAAVKTGKVVHLTRTRGSWPVRTLCGRAIRALLALSVRPTCRECSQMAEPS